MNRMYSRVTLLFLIAVASCSPNANAVELDAFPCTDDEKSKRRYKKGDDLYVCVNPTGEDASHYKISSLKSVSCHGMDDDNIKQIVIKEDGTEKTGHMLGSKSLVGYKGRGKKQAAPNGMGFKAEVSKKKFNKGDRRLVCQGTAEVEYTKPCVQQTYTLPTTGFDRKVNKEKKVANAGFCVLGAKDAMASVSKNGADYGDFTYETVYGLTNETSVWADRNVKFTQLEGNICEGGIFLQPSEPGLPQELDVTIEATEADGESDGVTICAIVEPPFYKDSKKIDRGGKWKDQLLKQGFEPKGHISYGQYSDRLLVLCKLMNEPCEENSRRGRSLESITEVNFETDVDIGDGCPDDIVVKSTDGVTAYPREESLIDSPVNIILQKASNVTVEMKNTWEKPISRLYYSYRTNVFSQGCFEVTDVGVGQAIDPFTIQCNALTPYAFLRICLQDTDLLVEGDNAKVNPCCEPENIDDPTVCYNIEIRCDTTCIAEESRRNLRAIAA